MGATWMGQAFAHCAQGPSDNCRLRRLVTPSSSLKLVAASSPPSPKNAPSSPSPSLERSRGWHIVIVVTYPDTIAGAEVHVRDLAKALYAKGHHLTVFVGGNGPFSEDRK